MIKHLKRTKLSDWLSAGALVLATIVLVRDCSQDKRIEELNYESKALQFRPVLKVSSEPEITFGIAGDTTWLRDFLAGRVESKDSILDIPVRLAIKAKWNVVNAGNSMAKVYGYTCGDTASGRDKFRQILLDEQLRERLVVAVRDTDYFALADLQPGDTTHFEIRHEVLFLEEDKFTLHFMLLYENEAHALYDTYYWARYTTSPVIGRPEFRSQNGWFQLGVKFATSELRDFVKLHDTNTSWRTYSKKEADDILGFFRRTLKRQDDR